jgi:hypothetical protein
VPLVTIPVGDGITIALPTTLTPLAQVKPALARAWNALNAAFTKITDARTAWDIEQRWWLLLFRLWKERRIEFASRFNRPYGKLTMMSGFPATERDWDRFGTDERYGQLEHLDTGDLFFDLHIRAVQSAKPVISLTTVPVVAVPASASITVPVFRSRPRRKGNIARKREDAFFTLGLPEIETGSPAWSTPYALRKALADPRYKNGPLFRAARLRSYSNPWSQAKARLQRALEHLMAKSR